MGIHALVFLLPDIALAGAQIGFRYVAQPGPIVQFLIAMTAGALMGCLWASFLAKLLESPEVDKFRNIVVGGLGGLLFGALYFVFEDRVFDIHEFLINRARDRAGIWAPAPSERHLILGLVGAFGAFVGLVVDRGLNLE